jgi:hypothetical protein
LEIGDYTLYMETGLPMEHANWLAQDFGPTDTLLSLDLSKLQHQIGHVFGCGAEFISVGFDVTLQPRQLGLTLEMQDPQEEGPEYLLKGLHRYQHYDCFSEKVVPVSVAERALLDVCFSTFADLASRYSSLFTEPLPPRFRQSAPTSLVPNGG